MKQLSARAALGLAAVGLVAACAPLPRATGDEAQSSVAASASDKALIARNLLLGEFSNSAQMRALEAAISSSPARSGAWIDAQHARFVAFENPRFGAHPLYFEWRSPGAAGPVTRRRIWVFEQVNGALQMRFFSFKDESVFADQSRWQDVLTRLDPAATVSYPEGCRVKFSALGARRFQGQLNPATCKIPAQRSGKELALAASIDISESGLRYQESGQYADGSMAFTVPGTAAYAFTRELLSPADALFEGIRALCGKTFGGRISVNEPVTNPPDVFTGETLLMHVRDCDPTTLRVPFHVSNDRSRTWVITRSAAGLKLKHDHRKADGSEDEMTMYGGDTLDRGLESRQTFPADAHSQALFTRMKIPVSNQNVWALELDPGVEFRYELTRPQRTFKVTFDLQKPLPTPPPAWGSN